MERVEIVNETSYSAKVEVSGSDRGWLVLTTVSPRSTIEVNEVIDQGDRWSFRFSYGTQEPVDVEVSRAELAEAGWQVEVPLELEEQLRAEGIVPPP